MNRTRTCWGQKTTATVFVPFGTVDTNQWDSARPSFFIESQITNAAGSGKLSARVAVQYSDDGITWGAATEFGPAATSSANAWQYGTAYTSISDTERYARFGVNCKTDGVDGALLFANITMKLDLRGV